MLTHFLLAEWRTRVQASEAGRIEPPDGGFPALGQRVARGEVLGFVVPIMAAQERVGVRVQPLDGQRVLVTAGLERGARVVTSGAGLIAQVR